MRDFTAYLHTTQIAEIAESIPNSPEGIEPIIALVANQLQVGRPEK